MGTMLTGFRFGHDRRRNRSNHQIRATVGSDVRHKNVVARVALIALFATVAVPGPAGSQGPSPATTVDPHLFERVEVAALARGTAVTIQPPVRSTQKAVPPKAASRSVWRHDPEISWFGPGLYGNGTACGQKMTRTLVGVAHRTLPCGTLVTFRNTATGAAITVPVVDRGPYVSGRTWDLTHGACAKIDHCYTGTIDWKLGAAG
jgi:rare lipoprotein A (peptidoglycan hydrolase)